MLTQPLSFNIDLIFIFKLLFLIAAVLYFIFTLIVIRQVVLMTQTVFTSTGGILRVISIILALIALGVVVLFFRLV